MAFQVQTITIDVLSGERATIVLHNPSDQTMVHITNLPIQTPGNQPENRLRDIAKDAARAALQSAMDAL